MPYQFLVTQRDGPIERLTLNRPDVRNAFNETMIAELTDWAGGVAGDPDVRVVVLSGAGTVFCAGADLVWMSKVVSYTHDENVRDATAAAAMYGALDALPVPVIGRIHGAALGGGAGLVAICDVAVADHETVFGFTEVKLGIVPAMISPFVLRRIGQSAARELFLTGMRFDAARAREIGLVHVVASAAEIDARVDVYLKEVLTAAPEAVMTIKGLIHRVAGRDPADVRGLTAETLATRRASDEGQEGMRAFLEKRRATWQITR
jgi:methylglutaconyl-CoA hydratase